jgi:endonuclease YncB( thermonuclease family)
MDAVTLESVIPNPDGKDEGNEKIKLKNHTGSPIDMTQWLFRNKKGKEVAMEYLILAPNQTLEINPAVFGLSLTNTTDEISLIDPAGNLIDRLHWTNARDGEEVHRPDFYQNGMEAIVKRVVDGDTFEVFIDGDVFTIRLIGVNTPEIHHPTRPADPLGQVAKGYLEKLLTGKKVNLEFDERKTDVYNRLLAYATVDGKMVNRLIIEKGFSEAYTDFPFKYAMEFVAIESLAKNQRNGVWKNALPAMEDASKILVTSLEETPEYQAALEALKLGEAVELTEVEITIEPADGEIPEDFKPVCPTDGLQIEAVLANAQKGESMEFIRVRNRSDRKICLNGWQLDDEVGKGSKPFSIRGGAIQPGGARTFRKLETKLALNNQDDCATLINPLGEVTDRLCYHKTQRNEVFRRLEADSSDVAGNRQTDSGNPEKPPVITRSAYSPETFVQELRPKLTDKKIEGKVSFIYEEGDLIFLESDGEILQAYTGETGIDLATVRNLIQEGQPVVASLYGTRGDYELVAIQPKETPEENGESAEDTGRLEKMVNWIKKLF